MAETAEKDDRDDKDEAEDQAEAKAEADEKTSDASEDEAPKPAKKAAKSGKARARGAARGRPAPQPAAQQGSSLGKSMILFVVIIGGLAAGFAILGREEQQAPAKPKWSVGQTVDVEITLVKSDKNDLACSSTEEVGGKHCAFEAMNKPWSKGSTTDDKALLKPYTTTDRIQFTAAGVWSDPALATSIPPSRFSLKCKYKVEGTLKNLAVRWDPAGQWFPQNEWFAGSVSDCKVVP
jgi:hypothetical protein